MAAFSSTSSAASDNRVIMGNAADTPGVSAIYPMITGR